MSELPSSEGLDPYPATDAPNPTTLSAAKSLESCTRGDLSKMTQHLVRIGPGVDCKVTGDHRECEYPEEVLTCFGRPLHHWRIWNDDCIIEERIEFPLVVDRRIGGGPPPLLGPVSV